MQTAQKVNLLKIKLNEANKRLNNSLPKLYRHALEINDAFTSAEDINFEGLEEATKAFYGYVRKALKVDGASLSE